MKKGHGNHGAFPLMENMGYSTTGIKDKEKALAEINAWIKGTDQKPATLDDIKESVMYWCGACEIYTMEEADCCECMETLKTRPRKTFIYYFN